MGHRLAALGSGGLRKEGAIGRYTMVSVFTHRLHQVLLTGGVTRVSAESRESFIVCKSGKLIPYGIGAGGKT
jgi:hypothetical protein